MNDISIYYISGYSTTSGYYFSKQEHLFASGSPRSNNMKGCVIIYSFPKYYLDPIDISNTLYGYQYGEYFGGTLASCDLNNDDKDDLIVGAPLWTRDMDEGRVYIFIAWKNVLLWIIVISIYIFIILICSDLIFFFVTEHRTIF